MTDFALPAPDAPASDAPASEWGALAVSIPGWRWPSPCPLPGWFRGAPDKDWQRVTDVAAYGWPDCERVPDPDHWAWEGWMLRLIGAGVFSVWMVDNWREGDEEHIGRACIRVAAALGRWPGGGA